MKIDTTNLKLIVLFTIMFVGILVAVVIHEIGHSTVCSYFGYDSPIMLTLSESSAKCEATGIERMYVRAAGGIAAAVFLLPLCFRLVRCNDYARFLLLAGGILHLIYMPVETFLKDLYGGIVVSFSNGFVFLNDIVLGSLLAAGISIAMLLEIFRFEDSPIKLKRLRSKGSGKSR